MPVIIVICLQQYINSLNILKLSKSTCKYGWYRPLCSSIMKGYHISSTIYFVWINSCIHYDELASQNAAVGAYKNNSFNKCNSTYYMYYYIPGTSLLAHFTLSFLMSVFQLTTSSEWMQLLVHTNINCWTCAITLNYLHPYQYMTTSQSQYYT